MAESAACLFLSGLPSRSGWLGAFRLGWRGVYGGGPASGGAARAGVSVRELLPLQPRRQRGAVA